MHPNRGQVATQLGLALVPVLALLAAAAPAHALTMKECSAKYQEAKSAGTLNGADWKTFRSTQCGASATPAAATSPNPSTSPSTGSSTGATAAAPAAARPPSTSSPAPSTSASATPKAPAGPATFPNAVNPKYASETPGQGRLHTCLDQYRANKASNANGGMRWIQKGGGFYSECSKHLKG